MNIRETVPVERGIWLALTLTITAFITACQPTLSVSPSNSQLSAKSSPSQVTWTSNFNAANWHDNWHLRSQGQWGLDNTEIVADPTRRFSNVLRVKFPKGSASPSVVKRSGVPLGGAQFYSTRGSSSQPVSSDLSRDQMPSSRMRLRYFLRFSDNFDFVKGGKLPGLYGGKGNSGGDIPNGRDGFSTRFMWRKNGAGEVYAYLPTSKTHGTSIGRGTFTFRPATWHKLEQEVQLNTPKRSDGWIKVWLDNRLVLEKTGLRIRKIDRLTLDGIFFSTFFGGDDTSWATPNDVYIDFAEFEISTP